MKINDDSPSDFAKYRQSMDYKIKLNKSIYGEKTNEEFLTDIIDLEKKFKKVLISTGDGKLMFNKFINFITSQNIMLARAYLREKQDIFSGDIFNHFRNNDYKQLFQYNFNYKFIDWAIHNLEGRCYTSRLEKIYKELKKLREVIIENNLPYSINRSVIFWKKCTNSPLDFMDMLQVSNEALICAIDKYVFPFIENRFRDVILHRIMAHILVYHNKNLLHFTPKEERLLYKTNQGINHGLSGQELVNFINENLKYSKIDARDIQDILAAVNNVDYIHQTNDDNETVVQISNEELIHNTATENPEDRANNSVIKTGIIKSLDKLTLIERKLICLKYGIKFGG